VIGAAFRVSVQVAIITSLVSAVLGTATAVIAMWVSRGMKRTIQGFMLLPLLVPEVALGYISAVLFQHTGSALWAFDVGFVPFPVLCSLCLHHGAAEAAGD